jgi:hypothetical protein
MSVHDLFAVQIRYSEAKETLLKVMMAILILCSRPNLILWSDPTADCRAPLKVSHLVEVGLEMQGRVVITDNLMNFKM